MQVNFSGGSFVVDTFPGHRIDSWLTHGRETSLRELYFYPFVRSTDVVVDVGAAFGSWTIPACMLANQGHVYAFEPRKEIVDILIHNLAKNDLANCTIFNYAAGAVMGKVSFCSKHNSSCAICDCPLDKLRYVPVGTIDNAMFGRKGTNVQWIKVDAEGLELEVLKGARDTIRATRPNIIVENHLAHDDQMYDRVASFVHDLVPNSNYMSTTRSFGMFSKSRPHTIFSVHPEILGL